MSADAIDRATFDDLRASAGAEFVRDLVETFAAEAPLLVGAMSAAHAATQPGAFRRAAHSLKSNALTFGALPLARTMLEWERGGLPRDGFDPEPLRAALDDAVQALKALCRE
jgi:HPt (histidine-containing phosphotransfer) domain-containing protein